MTAEEKLKLLLNADRASARDLAFEVAVAERIARRRAFLSVAALTPPAAGAAAVLWACRPVVDQLSGIDWGSLTPAVVAICAGAITALGVLQGVRRLEA